MDFTISLDSAPDPGADVVVTYSTASGSATEGVDFTATSGSLTFTEAAPGPQTVQVPITADNLDENNETVNLNTTSSLPSASGTGTIADDDNPPTISIDDPVGPEGNSGTSARHFTVSLSNPSSSSISVFWSPGSGTASGGSDFTIAPGGTLVFAAGETSKQIPFQVVGDTTDEPNETVVVNLTGTSGPAGAISKTQGAATIQDDDDAPPTPALSIGDLTVPEGVGTASVAVTLSSAAGPGGVTVNATTSDGSAAAPGDYAAGTVTVSIPAGQTTGEVPIPITNDNLDEPSESFTVTLSGANNATIADGSATVTITDNDTNSTLGVSDPAPVNEPGSGASVNVVFTVTLSPASARTVTVPYSTVAGTATAGSDFTATSGTLTFTPGQTSKTVNVTVLGDAVNEPNETFTFVLGPPFEAKLGDGTGNGLIIDPSAPPSLTISDASISEGGGNVQLTVTLAGTASSQNVTVNYRAANGTSNPAATVGADFTATSGTLTFTPGQTTKTITIPIVNDTAVEADETFLVLLEAPAGATLAKTQASVRIIDNESGPGSTSTPATTPRTTPRTTPTPTPTPTPKPAARALQAKLLSAKLSGKVKGKRRVTIRVSLGQLVDARIVMLQGKRKVTSSGFVLRRGNRSVYVLLPGFVKKGKVQLQLHLNSKQGTAKTLRTSVTLKA